MGPGVSRSSHVLRVIETGQIDGISRQRYPASECGRIAPIAGDKLFAPDRTLSDHGQHSLAQAFESIAIISATDPRGRITYANERFTKISGYSSAELIGQSHSIINSGHHPSSFFKEMWRTIASGETWQGEIKNRAKDGSFYWVNTVIVPSRNMQGVIDGYVSVRIDITKEKLAEEGFLSNGEPRSITWLAASPRLAPTRG